MRELLIQQLHEYVRENNPDLLWALQQEKLVNAWLEEKVDAIGLLIDELLKKNEPATMIMDRCTEELTRNLRPSKYHYIREIVEQEFQAHYNRLEQAGVLLPELINLIIACNPAFTELEFKEETEDDPHLRYCVMGIVEEYFEQH